ncbi:MAG: DUF4384 domain-containing protein [Phycisphaerae bacterium]
MKASNWKNRILNCMILIFCLIIGTARAEDHALLVGINSYRDQRIPGLLGCEDDVGAIKQMLIEVGGYKANQIRTVLSDRATADVIRNEMETWLLTGTKPGDRVAFYYSGHGSQKKNPNKPEGWDEILCPTDYNPQTQEHCIRDVEIGQWLKRMDGRNVTLIVDSCHSGSITKSIKGMLRGVETVETMNTWSKFIPPPEKDIFYRRPETNPGDIGKITQESNAQGTLIGASGGIIDEPKADYVLFTACANYQRTEEIRIRIGETLKRRGAFTWVLVKGLSGAADENGDGKITNLELYHFVCRTIQGPELDISQTPEFRTRQVLMNQPVFGKVFTVSGLGKIIDVKGNRVTINRGVQHGVSTGDYFLVKSDPNQKTSIRGTLRVEEPEEFLATGKILKDSDRVKPGLYVQKDTIRVDQRPLKIFIVPFSLPDSERFCFLLRQELSALNSMVITDSPPLTDRFVVLRKEGNKLTTLICSRFGTIRSRFSHENVSEAVASVVRRLRGEWLLSQIAAISNSTSDIKIDLSINGDRDTYITYDSPDKREQIRFRVRVNRDCFVTLFSIDSQGEVRMLLPNKWQKDNKICENRDYTIPAPGQLAFDVLPPPGRDVVKAIATTQPLALAEVNVKSLEKQGYITLTDGKTVIEAFLKGLQPRAIAVSDRIKNDSALGELTELPTTGWSTAQIVVNTMSEP